jgi:hypothetical protein
VWGSEFTTKAATQQGDSAELVPSLQVAGLNPVISRARVLVHEEFRVEELAERINGVPAFITPGSSSKSTAWGKASGTNTKTKNELNGQ